MRPGRRVCVPLATPPSLDYIEKTFADGYRKEIDQEENARRSLPFFAATLALRIAASVGMAGRLSPPDRRGAGG